MLVVKIELWPGGRENEAREIGRMIVSNDGTGTVDIGDYNVVVLHGGEFFGKPGAWKTGRVLRFVRKLSPYHLVLYALEATIGRGANSRTTRPAVGRATSKPCNGCGQPIVWTRSSNGKAMPLDPDPIKVVLEAGPLRVVLDDGRVVAARKHEGTDLYEPVLARVSHFSTCEQADRFRS